jgi:hypothetical protein
MKLKVQFEVTVPDHVTIEQAEEWLRFQIGASGGMKSANPLSGDDLEARSVSVDQI